jgi:hypothetical protein
MYPGNHTDSEILSVPRNLKAGPDSTPTHLAYITDDEADLLEIYKPDTPHKGPERIPNYDDVDWNTGNYYSSEQLDYGGTASGSSAGTLGGDPNAVTGSSHGDPQSTTNVPLHMITDFSGERPDTFTPHHELYGANQSGVIPGETQYERTNITKQNWAQYGGLWHSLQKMDPNTLKFYGYAKGSYSIPNELMNLVAQGSIVSGNEDVMTKYLYNMGQKWGSGDDVDPYVGTWSDMESGLHPLMSYDTFNEISGKPYIGPIPNQRSGPGPGGRGGWGGGRGGGGGGGGGRGGSATPKYGGDFAGENPWGLSQIQRAWINQLRGMNRGGIVSLC